MKTQMISFEGMALDTLAEAANDAGEQVEKHAKSAVSIAITAGKALIAAKSQVPHGEWLGWLGKNWNYKQSTAQTYMLIANSQHAGNLADAKSIREALRMMSDAKQEAEPEIVPRAQRKTGRVEVVKPDDEPGQQSVQPDENAVPAEPKTNTKHSKATAKAKEVDRAAPMKVTPEIIDEPETPKQWPEVSLEDLINGVIKKLEHDKQKKAAAKTLRKLADTLDPPKKFTPPDIDEVTAYCRERRNDIDPEAFVAHYATNGWKLSNGNKMADWKSAVITWEKSNGTGGRRTAAGNSGRGKPITDF